MDIFRFRYNNPTFARETKKLYEMWNFTKVIKLSMQCLLLLFIITNVSQGQEKTKKTIVNLKLKGFVAYKAFYDTREMVDSRDGQVILFPSKPQHDKFGNDLTDEPTLNMLSIETRLGAIIEGPMAFGGKTKGYIEGDFVGKDQKFISEMRLRYAYFSIDWQKFELLFGQTDHLMTVPEVIPGALTFAPVLPFTPLNRSPQVRLTYKFGKTGRLSGAMISQRDHANIGKPEMLRNSALPEMLARISFGSKDNLFYGLTLGYKRLKPRSETDKGFKTTKISESYCGDAFLRLNTKYFFLKTLVAYGENMSNLALIGGFGKQKTSENIDDYDYVNLLTTSMYADIESNTEKVVFGVFAGYSAINGATANIDDSKIYARTPDVDYVYRISPRIVFKRGNFNIGMETIYLNVAYAEKYGDKRKVLKSNSTNGWRFEFMAKYSF